ncbi:hypothetical protein EON65_07545 [archaeon]|nr:MAG: hypothetical protein EON65_07545 [archaeon]
MTEISSDDAYLTDDFISLFITLCTSTKKVWQRLYFNELGGSVGREAKRLINKFMDIVRAGVCVKNLVIEGSRCDTIEMGSGRVVITCP